MADTSAWQANDHYQLPPEVIAPYLTRECAPHGLEDCAICRLAPYMTRSNFARATAQPGEFTADFWRGLGLLQGVLYRWSDYAITDNASKVPRPLEHYRQHGAASLDGELCWRCLFDPL